MSTNGQLTAPPTADGVLRWPRRVVAVEELRRRLNGHRELLLSPGTVVTPSALDELRTRGVALVQEEARPTQAAAVAWGYSQDRAFSVVQTAARALQRAGFSLKEWPAPLSVVTWANTVAQAVAGGECQGGVLFCDNPPLVCCVANKVPGVRAAAVATIGQATQALTTFAPNLVVVEMPGRTFFEIRHILQTFCATTPRCPESAARVLRELDGHAHR